MNYLRRWREILPRVVGGGGATSAAASRGYDSDDEDADSETAPEEAAERTAMLPQGSAGREGGKTHKNDDDDEDCDANSSSPLSPMSRASSRYSSSGGGGGAARKVKRGAKESIATRQRLNSNALESSEEESSTARLSRRSSVLVDLFALFRRSSSIGQTSRSLAQRFRENDDLDESDEEDDGYQEMSKEKLLEAIRQKKEIIEKVRLQAWNMRRKRRTLKVAQRHLQRQKAQVSKVHFYKVEFQRSAKALFRWLGNASKYLIPWESKIKRIESHFGSVVSSYFIFLRWVLSVNITMSLILLLFVVIPEWLADMQADEERINRTLHSKQMPEKVREHATELNTVLDFGGYLQYSYLFYGYYSSETYFGNFIKYNVPIAYFCVNLFILAFCLFIILKKMTSNTRRSKLSGNKQEQYVFTWKVITGWDYNIGNSETAGSLYKANVIKLREATADYNKKIKQKWTWMIFVMRVLVNTVILSMFALSVYAIYQVAQITEKDTFIKQNAVSITVVVTTILFPPIFELILRLERYRPRTALRTHLFRVLFFYLINYFTLIYSLFKMLNNLEVEMRYNKLSNQMFQQQTDSFHIVHNPYSYNQSYYEVIPSRSSRQIHSARGSSSGDFVSLLDEVLPTAATTMIYYTNVRTPSTTMEPLRPWTTVFPNYGPFGVGVYNPKAIVVSGGKRVAQRVHNTVYESRAIGPSGDWSLTHARSTQGPVTLNYTSSPRKYYQMYRASNYDDLCWETLIGQEIAKIVTTDLVLTIVAILVIDFLRDIWIRYCGSWWCWDIEGTFPEYAEFKVAENVLHLVNNQGMIWLGTVLVPMLPMINNINLIILMYIRAWACMTCNVPARQIFRASRSSNFYYWILLLMLCMSTLPVGFVIASKKPSKNCGPFGGQERFYSVISEVLHNNLNKNIVDVIQYIMSPGIVIPILLLMLLIIYFLILLVSGLEAANTDLSKQLTHERTEEKKKIFELAGGGRKRPSQFTFHRPSDFNARQEDGSSPTSRHSSPRSRSTPRDFSSESPPRRRAAGGGSGPRSGSGASGGGFAAGTERASGFGIKSGAGGSVGGGSPTRTSWHGSARGSPDGKTTREGAYRKRAAGIRRTVTERGPGALRVGGVSEPLKAFPHHSKSENQLHLPAKSPINQPRFPSFLPSLQSVNEDDDEENVQSLELAGGKKRGSGDAQKLADEADGDNSNVEEEERYDRTRSGRDGISGGNNNGAPSAARSSFSVAERAPVRLTWRQKILVWIGLADPKKLELQERLRRQIACNRIDAENRRMEAVDAEAAAGELATDASPPPSPSVGAEQGRYRLAERRPLKSSLRKKKAQDREMEETTLGESPNATKQPPLPKLVVESGSDESAKSGRQRDRRVGIETQRLTANDSERRADERDRRRPSPLLLEEADYSLASDESAEEVNNDDEVEQIAVVSESTDSSSSGTATTAALSESRSRAVGAQNMREKLFDTDNVISESSPVVGRRHEDAFPGTQDANRLSGTKRSPRATTRRELPPSPTLTRHYEKRTGAPSETSAQQRRGSPLGKILKSPRFAHNDIVEGIWRVGDDATLMQASDDPTVAPSDDNSSFHDPVPLTPRSPTSAASTASLVLQQLRRASGEALVSDDMGGATMSDSFRYAEDPRLAYSNPYSSYAAAMCSPIALSDLSDTTQKRQPQSAFHFQSQSIQPQPYSLHHSYHQALKYSPHDSPQYSSSARPQYMPTAAQQLAYTPQNSLLHYDDDYHHHRPLPYDQAYTIAYDEPQQQRYRTMEPLRGWPPLLYETGEQLYNHHMTPSSQAIMYDVPPTAMYTTRHVPSYNTLAYHSLPHVTSAGSYPTTRGQQRRQDLDQQQHLEDSPISTRGGRRPGTDERGSTSGRGTIPPDYLTESPSGSSPEFGKPKYRIAQSPMSGHRSDQGGYSSDTSGVRRFDIRQKSAVGGGSPRGRAVVFGGSSRVGDAPPDENMIIGGTYSQQTTV